MRRRVAVEREWCLCLDGACGDEGGGLLPHHCMYYLGGGERRVGASGNGRGVRDSGYGYVSFLFVLGFFVLFEGRVRLVMVIMAVVHEYDSFSLIRLFLRVYHLYAFFGGME